MARRGGGRSFAAMHRHLTAFTTTLLLAGTAFAADAHAGELQLHTPGSCFDSGAQLVSSGRGFTPDLAVEMAVRASDGAESGGGSALTDGDGSFFDHDVSLPDYDRFVPRTVTVSATDQVDAARSTSFSVQQVKHGVDFPLQSGRSSATAQWRFAGFPTGAPVYGHYRTANRTVKTVKFGTAQGPCGTLSVRARRIPVKAKPGTSWYLQVDSKPRFSFKTQPEYDVTFDAR